MDQDMTPDMFLEWQNTAVSTLLKLRSAQGNTEDSIVAEIEQLMPMAQEEGWLHMEWFMNVQPAEDIDQMEGVEVTGGNMAAGGNRRNLRDGGSDYIGLGTMLQEATDYLGERQRDDYQRWKAGIIARIEEIEAR